jgi:hypothetical protein
MMIKPDIYVPRLFHLEPCCVIDCKCLLLVPTHHEMYNETQNLFTAASGGTCVKQYGYRNGNQLIMNSPWQLEQNKNISEGQRTHVYSASSTMYRLHFCHSLIGKDSSPGRGKSFFKLILRMQIISWGPLRLPFNGYCKKG